MLNKFIKSEAGATAIEYGLIAAGIAVAIAVVVFTVGSKLNTLFSNIAGQL
jgi:pilus assembly protein Flp/PilA